jgi:glycosyltransferase involved in cell wall biosynthesis
VPPHRAIAGTAGSDDHGGIDGGTTFTLVPNVRDVQELLAAMAAGEVRPAGEDGSPEKLAHTGFRIAGAAYAEGESGRLAGFPPELPPQPAPPARAGDTSKLLEYLPLLASLEGTQIRSVLAGRYERRIADALVNAGSGLPVLGALSSIGGFVDGHLFIAPYVGVHGYFGREIQKTRALRRDLGVGNAGPLRVGVFVDEMHEIHGVATMYQNLQRLADRPSAARLTFVQCGPGGVGETVCLRAIAALPVPLNEGRTLGVPSLLDVLDHVAAERYDVLHVATPGPLGLAVLVAGSTLGLPVVGAYHTEFGAYAQVLSGDALVAELVEVLVREFYERCAVVAVSSESTAAALRARGYQIGRFEVLKNGVDTRLYGPNRRDDGRREALGDGRLLLLYAGRVSREKGLERLAEGYLSLRERRDDVQLVVAGDGPYRRELEAMLGEAATFTGFLRGEELARIYASCDVFVFPSTTDTLGRAVAEAQASGLPAVVYGMGGPRECLRPGESGFVVDAGDEAGFLARVEELLDDTAMRQRMGRAARAFAETLSWDSVLDGLIALYQEVAGAAAPRSVAEAGSVEAGRVTGRRGEANGADRARARLAGVL